VTAYVLTCDEVNVVPASSSSAGTTPASCTAPYFAPVPSFLPPLSMVDGGAIGMAILAAWAMAFGWKSLRRVWS
jgi:hypothetical protein